MRDDYRDMGRKFVLDNLAQEPLSVRQAASREIREQWSRLDHQSRQAHVYAGALAALTELAQEEV